MVDAWLAIVGVCAVGSVATTPAVEHSVNERQVAVMRPGAGGYVVEIDRRDGTWSMVHDGTGARYEVPPPTAAVLGTLSPGPKEFRHHLAFAQQQVAFLRVYPHADPDVAIEHPVMATGVPLAGAPRVTAQDGVVVIESRSRKGDRVIQEFGPHGIRVRVEGPRGPYRVQMLVPIPDGVGHIHAGMERHWLDGFARASPQARVLRVFSPYRPQALELAHDEDRTTHLAMQDEGRGLDRATIPHSRHLHLAAFFSLPSGRTFTLAFPTTGETRFESERILSLRPRHEGTPEGPAILNLRALNVALQPSEPLKLMGLHPERTGLAAPQCMVFASHVEDGDVDFWWRQVQPDHWMPGMVPFAWPSAWLPLATRIDGDQVTAALPGHGIYRVRLACADGATPSFHAPLSGDLFVAVGQPEERHAVFSSSHRRVFMRGELLPVSVVSNGPGVLWLDDGERRAPVWTVEAADAPVHLALDTGSLKPGRYTVQLESRGEVPARWWFTLVRPERDSSFILEDNALNPAPFDWDLPVTPFGGARPVAWMHGFARPYSDLGIGAMRRTLGSLEQFAPQRALNMFVARHGRSQVPEHHPEYSLMRPWFDSLVEERIGYWQGVPSRGLSFTKARTVPEHVDGMARLLAIKAQRLRRHPNFGGLNIDVDTARTHPDTVLEHTNVKDLLLKRVRDVHSRAQMEEFKLFQKAHPSNEPYHVQWSRYLAQLFPKTNGGLQHLLKSLDPSLRQTSNTEYNHAPTHHGAYPPSLYEGLDFTSLEAWGDMRFHTLQNAYWTALADAGRKVRAFTGERSKGHHPLWVQAQAYSDTVADHLERNWWESLAWGAEGAGYAANIHGLNMYGIQTHVADEKRDRAVQLGALIQQLGPFMADVPRQRDVAILHSFQQGAHPDAKVYAGEFSNPIYVAFHALTQAQYTPDIVYEESIRAGMLDRYKVLVLSGQLQPLPDDVVQRITQFQQRGGVVVADTSTTVSLPGLRRMAGVDFSRIRPDRPTVWFAQQRYLEVRSGLHAALAPLAPRPAWTEEEDALIHLAGEDDARVLLVLNNRYLPADQLMPVMDGKRPVDWLDFHRLSPQQTRVYLREAPGRVYNLLTREPVDVEYDERGAFIRVDFTLSALGWFMLLPQPPAMPGLQVAVDDARAAVRVEAAQVTPLRVRWLDPKGREVSRRFGSTRRTFSVELSANDPTGPWTVEVTELVRGRTVRAEVPRAAEPVIPSVVQPRGTVLVHDQQAIAARLARGRALTILLDSAQRPLMPMARELAHALRQRGVRADVWFAPAVVKEPMDWLYTPPDERLKERIARGEVIGERFWRGAPSLPSWKADGTHLERDVLLMGRPSHNRWMAELEAMHVLPESFSAHLPGMGQALLQHAWAPFSAHHHVVVLAAPDEAGLRQGIKRMLQIADGAGTPAPDIMASISSVRGRFLHSLGFEGDDPVPAGFKPVSPVRTPVDDDIVELGRPVHSARVSPNGEFTAVTIETRGNNVMLLAADGSVLWHTRSGAASIPVVRGVSNDGDVAVDLGDFSEIFDRRGQRTHQLVGQRVQWLSADGREALLVSPTHLQRVQLTNGRVLWSVEHGIPPSAQGHIMHLVVDSKGELVVGPSWDPMAAPNGNVPPDMEKVFLAAWDNRTGAPLWKKKEFHGTGIQFSADGGFIGAARLRFYRHPSRKDVEQHARNHDAVLVLMDPAGHTLVERRTDIPIGKALPSDDGQWVMGIPLLTQPHAFVLHRDGRLQRLPLNGSRITAGVALDDSRVALATIDGDVHGVGVDGSCHWSLSLGRQARLWRDAHGLHAGTMRGDLLRINEGRTLWRRALAPLSGLDSTAPPPSVAHAAVR